jgi:arginyl-tRNA synthetase
MLSFCGSDVKRINHIGDWGTQFGMLLTYMRHEHPDFLKHPPSISDLDVSDAVRSEGRGLARQRRREGAERESARARERERERYASSQPRPESSFPRA